MDLELLWRKRPDNGFFRLLRNMVERYFDHGVGRSAAAINKYSREADKQNALDSDYELDLPLLT